MNILEDHFSSATADIEISEELKQISQKLNTDDFKTLKLLGRGMFGKVLLVEHTPTGKYYALKSLSKNKVIKLLQVEHTKSERKVLAKLHHPFIVSLEYAFQTDCKLYIALEYVSGGDLFQHLSLSEYFPEARARFYAAEVLLALEFMHSRNIIYRDLKPENILIDQHGNIKVTDLGLAKELTFTELNGKGRTKTFCGTNEYIAPELILGQAYGESVDWWSLGILIYEMLTGWPPWSDDNRDLLFKKIVFEPLSVEDERLSLHARDLLEKMLRKKPEERIAPADIKKHPFFAPIDFEKLLAKKIEPPFKPDLKSPTDDKYFDQSVVQEDPMKESPAVALSNSKKDSYFNSFSFSPGSNTTYGV
eukprot:TRINITY_DN5992_c0_g1_i1.p1 TRINITY_DN5992_c0_g1~~TRINITY_DN5992_c0_g1_i1.p1  ORF type:complete len:363 (-),score=132.27 TRINITY_DN5992_c0_g1_i1:1249-2337(-)